MSSPMVIKSEQTGEIIPFESFSTDGWQSIEVLRAHIRELQTEIESKDAEIVRLRQSFADLVGIQNGGEKTHYTWIEFVAAGTASIGKTKGFQLAFLDCNPEYSSGDLSAWRRLDKVPADAMTRLTALKMKVDSSRGQSWTPEEYDYLQSVLNETPKIKMLALSKLLSQKFGRYITEGAAKAAKYRLLNPETTSDQA